MTENEVTVMLAEAIDQDKEYKSWHISTKHLMIFAAMVAAKEREACAKICDESCYGSTKVLVEKAIQARSYKQDGQCKRCTDGCPACDARKLPEQEPWSPVSIGVDVTKEGAHVVGIYALDKDTSQIFYAKYHYAKDPQASQRKWVGLTDEEIWETISRIGTSDSDVNPYAKLADARAIEAKLKEKNT